ncbi:MAG: CTP-dependent riboflavin kinase [Nitrososphaeraceae archaeon]|jgi:riboflavin kinase|nr:CTP-dependent riboflavin kinase [Nitrososphaeraceae archaeon]MDW3603470.1 CTP-dependent riboflavin kinase [Nitrososphaeraceae archaeon]MDW3610518.1 CTP-dependent riboflavin kinase [Nitrososphaeraceae archaeon]MDW3625016.1 CTP-dependent riboflavin kinase [Nitrososphaeraceae archaeon]MDW3629808.1 CTP-dependent riboflavin kinase [Nitrososphaeraceae archaeon]
MSNITFQHIVILSELLLCGAKNNFVELTTNEIAKKIKRSQQLASKELLDLEFFGCIKRNKKSKKYTIKVTERGYQQVYDHFLFLKTAVESFKHVIDFEGHIITGMGEGAYYMSLDGYKKQFKEKLGYEPYPGTLNIKLNSMLFVEAKKEMLKYPSINIEGFSDQSRTFGWVKCYPASINDSKNINSSILILERTHYDDSIIELIAPFSIKEQFSLKNGDYVKLKVNTNNPL